MCWTVVGFMGERAGGGGWLAPAPTGFWGAPGRCAGWLVGDRGLALIAWGKYWLGRGLETTALRYLIAGGSAASLQLLLVIGLVEVFDAVPLIATSVGFVVGGLINYVLQYYWTFEADGPHHLMLTRYALVTAGTLLINDAVFWLLTEKLGVFYIFAQVSAIGLMVIVNYLINKHYTFVSIDSDLPPD